MRFKIKKTETEDEDIVCEVSLRRIDDSSVHIMIGDFNLGKLSDGELNLCQGLFGCKGITLNSRGEIRIVNSRGKIINGVIDA